MGEIADKLNSKKVPTKRKGTWNKGTISNILKNPVYCGYLKWEDYINKGEHEAIISPKIFNETQATISYNKGKPGVFL